MSVEPAENSDCKAAESIEMVDESCDTVVSVDVLDDNEPDKIESLVPGADSTGTFCSLVCEGCCVGSGDSSLLGGKASFVDDDVEVVAFRFLAEFFFFFFFFVVVEAGDDTFDLASVTHDELADDESVCISRLGCLGASVLCRT